MDCRSKNIPGPCAHPAAGHPPSPSRKTGIEAQLTAEVPHLRRYARSLALTDDLADDYVQDCLEKAIRNADRFQAGSNLRRWLFTILRNIHIDNLRRSQRRGYHGPVEDWYRETHVPPRQEAYLRVQELRQHVRRLKPQDRELLRLVFFKGLTYRSAASRLEIAEGTVKSRVSRLRNILAT